MTAPLLVIYRALGLGDLLTAVPALRALARAFPGHRRVLAAPRALAPLAQAVDEVVDVRALEPLPQELHGADVAVNLHGRGPQSHEVLLAARPRRLVAFAHDAVWSAGRDQEVWPAARDDAAWPAARDQGVWPAHEAPTWRPGEHEVVRWCRLLEESGIPADPGDLLIDPPPIAPPPPARDATLIHPGAASGARRWPADRWAAVARAERAAGRPVAITGSAEERDLAASIADAAGVPDDAILAGRTTPAELAAAVAAAARVACGDTGVAHLAAALHTPSVVLFGPTPPAEWGPPPTGPHTALWAGRRGDPHAQRPDPGMLQIQVGAVTTALAELPVARFPVRSAGRPTV